MISGTNAARPGRKATRIAVATVAAAALALTACSSKAEDDNGGGDDGAADDGALATGPGVTDDTITIGALTDMTGPYATLGTSVTQAQELYVAETNAAGGICDRELELQVRDHNYDAGLAGSAYAELEPSVIGFAQFIGSPYVAAAQDGINANETTVIAQAWTAELLGSPYIHMVGATYDIETINAVDFLLTEHGLTEGDRIGHVYFEGDYGENALQGSEYAAAEAGLEVVGQAIKPTDEDMTAPVTALAREGVAAIIVSAGPPQAASVAGVAAAAGLNVPIVGNNSSFAPQLLGTEAAPALLENFYVAAPSLPIGSEDAGPGELTAAYLAEYPDAMVDLGVVAGYGAMDMVAEGLRAACDAGDLTRAGLADGIAQLNAYDQGFGVTHDFSDPSTPSSLESFILKPDADVPGGLTVEAEAAVSDMAAGFTRD